MRLIFDIGCSVGKWIKANYRTEDIFYGFDADIRSVERSAICFSEYNNVHIIHKLITDHKELQEFYQSETSEVSTASKDWIFKSRHSAYYNEPVLVDCETLDGLILNYGKPQIVKIDVEGYEYNVLWGLSQKVGMIAFEFVEELPEELYKCLDRLKYLGYTDFNWSHGDAYTYIPTEWLTYEEIVKIMQDMIIPERKSLWGMIYAK